MNQEEQNIQQNINNINAPGIFGGKGRELLILATSALVLALLAGTIWYFFLREKEGLSGGWSEANRLTQDSAVSALGPNFVHNLAIEDNNIYLAFSDGRDGNPEIYFKYSNDLGDTWSEDIRITNNSGISWVPSIAVSDNYVHLAWNEDKDGNQENYYIRSTDGGETWEEPVRISNTSGKSWAADIAADGDNVYISWQEQDARSIYFSHSSDKGNSWKETKAIVTCDSQMPERPNLLIDENLTLHIAYYFCEGDGDAYYINSADYGLSWTNPVKILNESTSQANGLPTITIDEEGRLHTILLIGTKTLVGKEYKTDLEVHYLNSSDNGKSWGNQMKLSEGDNNSSQPIIVYGQETGLHAFWMNDEVSNNKILYRYSLDKGQNWSEIVTLVNLNQKNLLTSPHAAVDGEGIIHLIFEDDKDGNREVYYIKGHDGITEESTSGEPTSGSVIFPELNDSQSISDEKYVNINTDDRTQKAPGISRDGLELYFYSRYEDQGGTKSIYTASRDSIEDNWSAPSRVIFKDNNGNEIDTSKSEDVGNFVTKLYGKEVMFLASTGSFYPEQAYGSTDLYVSFRNSDGTFGQPLNLGQKVNTADGEIGPTVYFDDAKGKGIIFYSVGWKQQQPLTSNQAHKNAYPQYEAYLEPKDENIWFNVFTYDGSQFVFDEAKFFKYNTIGTFEDNTEISSDGKVIFYNGANNAGSSYSDLEFAGDWDIYYTFLEDNQWVKPRNIGGGAATSGHDSNPALLLLDNTFYLFLTYADAPPPYEFDLYDYYIGRYEPPVSSGDIFDNLPEMTDIAITECGDGVCSGSETHLVCPEDCQEESFQPPQPQPNGNGKCGDGTCQGPETSANCPQDCDGETPQPLPQNGCGDGVCQGPETSQNCSEDCINGQLDCDLNNDGVIQPVEESRCGDNIN